MDSEEREFLLMTAWFFARHGQRARALTLLDAAAEAGERGGVAATMRADLLLGEGRAEDALEAIRAADPPKGLERAAALMEARALRALGRTAESESRWRRYLASRAGANRAWVAEGGTGE